MMKNEYVLNPQTGRMIKRDTSKCRRMIKEGLIPKLEHPKEQIAVVQEVIEEPQSIPVNVAEIQESEPLIKRKLAKVSVNIIKKNTEAFRDLSEKETTTLLRKLLIQKLAPKTKKVEKIKKKDKFKLKEPSSSESESSSSSDSDSD
jgi:hypothetical protein